MGFWSDLKSRLWPTSQPQPQPQSGMGNCFGKQEPEHDPIPSQSTSESRITSTNVLLEEKREGHVYGSAANGLGRKKTKRPPAAAVTRQNNSASSVNLGATPISASDSTFTSISDSRGARFTLSDVPGLNRPSQPFVCMHLSGLAMQAALYKNIGVQQLSLSSYSDNSNAPTWMMAEWTRSEKAKFNMTFGARAAHMTLGRVGRVRWSLLNFVLNKESLDEATANALHRTIETIFASAHQAAVAECVAEKGQYPTPSPLLLVLPNPLRSLVPQIAPLLTSSYSDQWVISDVCAAMFHALADDMHVWRRTVQQPMVLIILLVGHSFVEAGAFCLQYPQVKRLDLRIPNQQTVSNSRLLFQSLVDIDGPLSRTRLYREFHIELEKRLLAAGLDSMPTWTTQPMRQMHPALQPLIDNIVEMLLQTEECDAHVSLSDDVSTLARLLDRDEVNEGNGLDLSGVNLYFTRSQSLQPWLDEYAKSIQRELQCAAGCIPRELRTNIQLRIGGEMSPCKLLTQPLIDGCVPLWQEQSGSESQSVRGFYLMDSVSCCSRGGALLAALLSHSQVAGKALPAEWPGNFELLNEPIQSLHHSRQ